MKSEEEEEEGANPHSPLDLSQENVKVGKGRRREVR